MAIVFEIIIYLAIVLGILMITITLFDKDNKMVSTYVRDKKDGGNINVEIKFIGFNKQEIQAISRIIAKGEFDNIYDIADEFKVFMKEK